MNLKLDQIRRDPSAQPRAMLNTDHIKDLTDALGDGGDLTPVDVFHDGFSYWLADGFHRFSAYKQAKRQELPVTVHEGELRDAVLWSITANTQHSVLKLTREEKRSGVERLLRDKEWSKWSNREIARRAGVNDKTVAAVRNELTVQFGQSDGNRDLSQSDDESVTAEFRSEPTERTFTTKHGTVAKMQTSNIGSKPKPEPSEPAAPLNTYTPPLTPEQPEEDDRPEYDPYADEGLEPVQAEAEIVSDETEEEDEPYIPAYLNNPVQPTYEVKPLSNERKPKEPPFVMWYTLLGKVRSQGHRSLIDALNSVENQTQEQALENQVLDLIEMLRASLKQAEKERKTLEVTA